MRRTLLLAPFLLSVPIRAQAQSNVAWDDVCSSGVELVCGSIEMTVWANGLDLRLWNQGGLFDSSPYSLWETILIRGLPALRDATGNEVGYSPVFFALTYPAGPSIVPTGPHSPGYAASYEFMDSGFQSDNIFLVPIQGGPDQNTGEFYRAGAIASSCGYADNLGKQLFVSPTCGSAGLDDATVNGGWIDFPLMARAGYTLDPANVAALSVAIGNRPYSLSAGGGIICGGATGNCTTVAPEPAAIALLATGLVGLGAVGRRSRRQGVA